MVPAAVIAGTPRVKVFAWSAMLKVAAPLNVKVRLAFQLVKVVPVTCKPPPLSTKGPEVAPKLASAETETRPPVTVMPPLNSLTPPRTWVPAKALVIEPVPEIIPEYDGVPEAKLKVRTLLPNARLPLEPDREPNPWETPRVMLAPLKVTPPVKALAPDRV